MEVTIRDIEHLADLSNFAVNAEQVDNLTRDLQEIIKYISELDTLDTDAVQPTYQVFEMENVWRADEILPQDADREQLLALAPEEQDHQIKVPKVL